MIWPSTQVDSNIFSCRSTSSKRKKQSKLKQNSLLIKKEMSLKILEDIFRP